MKNSELELYLKNLLKDKYKLFLNAAPEPKALRINTLKISIDDALQYLTKNNISFQPVPFNSAGLVPSAHPFPVSQTLAFFKGWFQYQGIASQIPALALDPQPGETILDMAASPGSKSTQIAALMNNKGRLYLNDVSLNRLQALNANMQKSGALNHIITHLPGERFGNMLPEYFDKILLDAPCTALGTLASNPEMKSWWSEAKLKRLSSLQERLIISAFKALKPGGALVYSTCSIAPEENEHIIQRLIDHYPIDIVPIDGLGAKRWNRGLLNHGEVTFHPDMQHALRVLPHEHSMEGFFIVKLQKREGFRRIYEEKKGTFLPLLTASDAQLEKDLSEISAEWGIDELFWESYHFIRTKKRIWLINSAHTHIPQEGFMNGGMLFAEKKLFQWKLFNQSVQFLGEHITRRRISLDRTELKNLFSTGHLKKTSLENGYHVLCLNKNNLASIYADEGILKIRLPHLLNLPEQ